MYIYVFMYVHVQYPNVRSKQYKIVSTFHLRATEICVANILFEFCSSGSFSVFYTLQNFCVANGNYCKNLFISVLRILTELVVS